jgi:hypothetical protein
VTISFAFLNQLVKLTHVRAVVLVPFLMVLTAFGAYTAHNTFADIVVMLMATVVGVAAIRWDWPRAPLLLALVLGDIAERYLFLSYSLFEWQWIWRPLVVAFGAVTLAGLLWPLFRGRRSGPAPARHRADLPITLGLLVLSVWVLAQAYDWPFRTSVFPLATGGLLLLLTIVKLSGFLVGRVPRSGDDPTERGPATPTPDPLDPPDVFATATRAEWSSAIAWMAGFFLMLWLVGALIAVPLFALMYLLMVARQSIPRAGVYAVVSWLFIYGLFDRALRIPLPAGVLFS